MSGGKYRLYKIFLGFMGFRTRKQAKGLQNFPLTKYAGYFFFVTPRDPEPTKDDIFYIQYTEHYYLKGWGGGGDWLFFCTLRIWILALFHCTVRVEFWTINFGPHIYGHFFIRVERPYQKR